MTFTALGGKVSARKELGNVLINSRRQTGQVACGLVSRTHGASTIHSAARVPAVTERMRENRSHSRPTERDENLTATLIIKRIPASHMRGEQSLRVLTSGYVLTRDSESFISNYEGVVRKAPFPTRTLEISLRTPTRQLTVGIDVNPCGISKKRKTPRDLSSRRCVLTGSAACFRCQTTSSPSRSQPEPWLHTARSL